MISGKSTVDITAWYYQSYQRDGQLLVPPLLSSAQVAISFQDGLTFVAT